MNLAGFRQIKSTHVLAMHRMWKELDEASTRLDMFAGLTVAEMDAKVQSGFGDASYEARFARKVYNYARIQGLYTENSFSGANSSIDHIFSKTDTWRETTRLVRSTGLDPAIESKTVKRLLSPKELDDLVWQKYGVDQKTPGDRYDANAVVLVSGRKTNRAKISMMGLRDLDMVNDDTRALLIQLQSDHVQSASLDSGIAQLVSSYPSHAIIDATISVHEYLLNLFLYRRGGAMLEQTIGRFIPDRARPLEVHIQYDSGGPNPMHN